MPTDAQMLLAAHVLHRHLTAGAPPRFRLWVPPSLVHRLAAGGPLESWWLVAALAATSTSLVGAWWWVRRWAGRHGRRRVRWAARGAAATAALLAVVAVAVGVNAYAGYVPTVGDALALVTGNHPTTGQVLAQARPALASMPAPAAELRRTRVVVASRAVRPAAPVDGRPSPMASSTVVHLPIPAPGLGMPNGEAYVYLPPGYSSAHRYPVLYLLPGSPGGPTDWLFAGNLRHTADTLIRQHYAQPMIIVLPRTSPQWTVDYEALNAVRGPQVMTYLTDVVVPTIDARFATVAGRAGRALGGFSAGADGALNVGLHNLSLFSAIAAVEPQGWPGGRASWVVGHDPSLMWANSPIRYIPAIPLPFPVAVYLSGEGTQRSVQVLAWELRARGQTVVVHDEFGLGHTWVDARADLPYLLQFASEAIGPSLR